MKKILAVILTLAMALGITLTANSADPGKLPELIGKFKDGTGPEVGSLSVDYVYYEPQNAAGAKLPLVIYFHGAGQGGSPRAQIMENNFPLWASDELQSRFPGGGAYLVVPRSQEDKGEFWSDPYVPAVKALIDDFISSHAGSIDLNRIYIGGFSMGGKMTLKMISNYPGMFAAAFPACPAYEPTREQLEAAADLPIWLIVSRFDIIAGYYTFSKDIWGTLCEVTNVPDECRMSLFGTVRMPDGKKAGSNHFVWFALANDLFTYDEGQYPAMVTTTASGNDVTLESPDGLISWLGAHTGRYSGEALEATGLVERNPDKGYSGVGNILRALFPLVFDAIGTFFKNIFSSIGG